LAATVDNNHRAFNQNVLSPVAPPEWYRDVKYWVGSPNSFVDVSQSAYFPILNPFCEAKMQQPFSRSVQLSGSFGPYVDQLVRAFRTDPLEPVIVRIKSNVGDGTAEITGLYTNDDGEISSPAGSSFSGDISEVALNPPGADYPYIFGVIVRIITLSEKKSASNNNNSVSRVGVPVTSFNLDSVQVNFAVGNVYGYQFYSVGNSTEFKVLEENFTEFRPIGCSAWAKYASGFVFNGLLSTCCIKDGSNPFVDFDISPEFVNSIPGSYSGDLQSGAYDIYKPVDLDDVTFRDVDYDAMFRSPYFILHFQGTQPEASYAMRLRTCLHMETLTSSQMWPRSCVVSVPKDLLVEAISDLQDYPSCGENATHLRKIFSAMRRITRGVARNPMLDSIIQALPMPVEAKIGAKLIKSVLSNV
jgi:hypothetical protein